ncbi:MAG TPA: hypothetical protein VL096_03890, partial [Pirellulaceae bacterium]|nr:hypothetical protein [Pirellulaceae bacterium]
YLLRPGFVTALICGGLYLVGQHNSQRLTLEFFLAAALFLNSPIGRYATELSSDFLVRAFQELKLRVFAAAFQWIMAIFHGLLVMLERVVYMVDEWLLFRSGDNQLLHAIKLVGGVIWFFVAYVVVFVFTLLIEPQINPIKHFPVVTVSHKIIFPTWPVFVKQLTPYLGTASANWLVGTTIWLIPGVFGFLVWELKENWRLYAANRARTLSPAAIGQHGETMVRLLRPGFHSGTLPKAFAALRRAVRKAEHQGDANLVTTRQAAITHVAEAVQRFVERELLALLKEAGLRNSIRVGAVHSATNRIDVELHLPGTPTTQAVVLTWEEDQGKLTGLISQSGWLDELSPTDRDAFAMGLRGLFQRSDVDDVRGSFAIEPLPPIAWFDWVAYWSELPSADALHPPSPRTTSAMNRWIEKILAKPRRD